VIQKEKGPDTAATVNEPGNKTGRRQLDSQGGVDWQATAAVSAHDHKRLTTRGVSPSAITEPWPIRSARVEFDDLHGFDFNPEGSRALIFRAEDRGEEKDLIAWESSTGKLASRHGNTFCLGDVDQIDNPATYFMGGGFAFKPHCGSRRDCYPGLGLCLRTSQVLPAVDLR
jgi:hypothetical protein